MKEKMTERKKMFIISDVTKRNTFLARYDTDRAGWQNETDDYKI